MLLLLFQVAGSRNTLAIDAEGQVSISFCDAQTSMHSLMPAKKAFMYHVCCIGHAMLDTLAWHITHKLQV